VGPGGGANCPKEGFGHSPLRDLRGGRLVLIRKETDIEGEERQDPRKGDNSGFVQGGDNSYGERVEPLLMRSGLSDQLRGLGSPTKRKGEKRIIASTS